MAYIYAFVAVIGFAGQFCLLKLYQTRTINTGMKFYATLERASFFALATGIGISVIFFALNGFAVEITAFSVRIALLRAAIFTVSGVFGTITLSRGRLSVYTLFMMLGGMILPYLAGILIWEEKTNILGVAGVALLAVSLLIPALEKTNNSVKGTKLFYFLCVFMFLLNGMISVTSAWHQKSPEAVNANSLMVLCAAFASVPTAAVWLYCRVKKKSEMPESSRQAQAPAAAGTSGRYDILIIWLLVVVFSAVSGGAQVLQLLSARALDASVLFPVTTGGVIFFSAAAGYAFFREKPDKYSGAGIIIALFATILFAIGEIG
jgi:hypothetical protein